MKQPVYEVIKLESHVTYSKGLITINCPSGQSISFKNFPPYSGFEYIGYYDNKRLGLYSLSKEAKEAFLGSIKIWGVEYTQHRYLIKKYP